MSITSVTGVTALLRDGSVERPLLFGSLMEKRDPWPVLVERVQRDEALGFDNVWRPA